MSTPEGLVKDQIKTVLRKHRAWFYMPVPGGYGATVLDFICATAVNKTIFHVEAKTPGRLLSGRQVSFIRDRHLEGHMVFVIDCGPKVRHAGEGIYTNLLVELEKFLADS